MDGTIKTKSIAKRKEKRFFNRKNNRYIQARAIAPIVKLFFNRQEIVTKMTLRNKNLYLLLWINLIEKKQAATKKKKPGIVP